MTRIMSILGVTLALATTATSAGRDVSFRAQHNYAVGWPGGVAVGDFNADGRPDVALTNTFGSSVSVFMNGLGVHVTPAGSYPQGIALADFNGDSRLDAAVVDSESNDVALLLGNGDGSFEAARFFPAGAWPMQIAVADFNGDDAPDVVTWGGDYPDALVLLGNGDGTLQPAASAGFANTPWGLTVGDFNRDGHVDMAATIALPWRIAVLPGAGDGTFLPEVSTAAPEQIGPMAAGDFNGDGMLDIATEQATPFPDMSPGVGVFVGNGDGTFQPPTYTLSGQPWALATGDFNNDSKIDIAMAGGDSTYVLLGVGDGRLQEPARVLASGDTVAVADLNGDGNADLITSGPSGLSFRYGKGDGSFHQTPGLRTGVGTGGIVAADFNGDGSIDLAAGVGDTSPYLALVLGNGNGTFRPSPAVLPTSFHVGAMTPGDFDGDARIDIIAAGSSPDPGALYLFRGRGDGSLAPPELIARTSGSVFASDLNGDRVLDLVVVNSSTGVAALIGNGDGTFREPSGVIAGLNPHDAVVGDFNGDAIPDLAIANYNSRSISVALGNGDGTFRPPVDTAVGYHPYYLTAADFNRDGKTDLALSEQSPMAIRVLLGTGDGTFAAAVSYYCPTDGAEIRAADFNGDGQLDLAALGRETLWMFIGNSDGTFRLQGTGFSTGYYAHGVTVADFTSDGRLDVAVGADGRTLVSPAGIGIALLYNTTP